MLSSLAANVSFKTYVIIQIHSFPLVFDQLLSYLMTHSQKLKSYVTEHIMKLLSVDGYFLIYFSPSSETYIYIYIYIYIHCLTYGILFCLLILHSW